MLLCFASQKPTGDGPGRGWMITKVGIGVAALVAAVLFALRGSSEDEQLDTAESAVTYICWNDGHTFKLTPAQWGQLLEQGDCKTISVGASTGDGRQDGRSGSGAIQVVKCPKCQSFTCVIALDCPDGTKAPSITADGQAGQCPPAGPSGEANKH